MDRTHSPAGRTGTGRIVAVDALRGLVVLLLVPDLYGGFSFYQMARLRPDDSTWRSLAAQFSHVAWEGIAVWDLIMPAFVLLVGISLGLSTDRHRDAGTRDRRLLARAAVRSLMLFTLGMVLQVKPLTYAEELVPYLLLATCLPWARRLESARVATPFVHGALDLIAPAAASLLALVWLATNLLRLGGYDFNQILTQMGLAYLPAFLLRGEGLWPPVRNALLIVAAWGLLFALYPAPADAAASCELVCRGFFAHWNNGTNVAAQFDRWLFDALPRAQPYKVHPHGYHTLEFVPLIAQMLVGVAVARLLRGRAARTVSGYLAGAGIVSAAAGWVLAQVLVPLVKSLWTPSWALLSTGLCLVLLSAMALAFSTPSRSRWAAPLSVLGSNAIVLYVLAAWHRWRIVLTWERILGDGLRTSALAPVLESLLVLLSLWLLAWSLDRFRLHVRV